VAALAATSVRRSGAADIVICSRTTRHADRLAATVKGRPARWEALAVELANADLVICGTGAMGPVISESMVVAAVAGRTRRSPLVLVDLAMPRDVEQSVARLAGVHVIVLEALAHSVHNGSALRDVLAVKAIVSEEVGAFAAARAAARVAPTVVALRSMATSVVAAELSRLWERLGPVSDTERAEIIATVTRVADKLLHEPTVRVKQFAGRAPESSYADALAELFALDPTAVDAVSKAGEVR
jgi:glutamyl-tRNA reductase